MQIIIGETDRLAVLRRIENKNLKLKQAGVDTCPTCPNVTDQPSSKE